jgi:TRAP-type mannitol/chloroaromatic compound transport system permease small subunit
MAAWALLLACVMAAGNALLRYVFDIGSNAWLEAQWYLFAAAVMLAAPHLLRLNEHVRVDVIYGGLQPRTKAWVDVLGIALVLLPVCGLVVFLSLDFVLTPCRWFIALAFESLHPLGFCFVGIARFSRSGQAHIVFVRSSR